MKNGKKSMAVKIFDRDYVSELENSVQMEMSILKLLDHPNVVKYLKSGYDGYV